MKEEQFPTRLSLGVCIALIAYIFIVTASSLVWSFSPQFPTVQILFFQNLISFLLITPLALRKGIARLQTNHLPTHFLRDVVGVLSYYLYFISIRFLNLTDATTLNYTAPFFVPLIWYFWRKEKIHLHTWWAIVLGFLGIFVILNPSHQIFQEGFLFGICAGFTSAIALCSLKMLNIYKEPMSRTLFYYFFFGTITSLPFAFVYWQSPSWTEWVYLIGVGIATAIAQMLLTIAYRYGTASFLSPLGYSSVIYAAFSSYFIFHSPLGMRSIIGTALIICGGSLSYLLSHRKYKLKKSLESKDKPPPL